MTSTDFILVRLENRQHLHEAFRLRLAAWRADGVTFENVAEGELTDALDDESEHWGTLSGPRLVGAIRLSLHPQLPLVHLPESLRHHAPDLSAPIAFMSRLVVAPGARRRGLASLLVEHLVARAAARRAKSLIAFTHNPSRLRHLMALQFHISPSEQVTWGSITAAGYLAWAPVALARSHLRPFAPQVRVTA